MGFKDWYKAQDARHKAVSSPQAVAGYYRAHRIMDGLYTYLPSGQLKAISKRVAGAAADFESGADQKRTTLTRVAVGAIIAGPAGAIVGGMFKKDKSRVYVTVAFPDGEVAIVDGPAKDEKKLREFTLIVNRAGRHYAE